MTRLFLISALVGPAVCCASMAHASCFADYKAKQDDPLRLHYGVIELPDTACEDVTTAVSEIAARIAEGGWMLLDVMDRFDDSGLEERRESAGEFYLRF